MAIVRIAEVEHAPGPRLQAARLDAPRSGSTSETYDFELGGQVAATTSEVERVEVRFENRAIAVAQLGERRPEPAEPIGPGEEAATAGTFTALVGALEAPTSFELTVRAILSDGGAPTIATIRGSREPLSSDHRPRLQPAMINCVGRSGTTWLAWLMGAHPELVAFEPFSRETRVSTYWATVLQQLGAPNSYLAQFDPVSPLTGRWWLGDSGVDRRITRDGAVARWLGVERLRLLAGQCQQQIDRFYRENAEAGAATRYFVEKFSPSQTIPDLLGEIYPGAREVILVRDFRDMFCSIRAYVAKRGGSGFRWGEAESEIDYVRTTLRGLASGLLRRWRRRQGLAHLVRYEDLVLEPNRTLTALAEYLEIDAGAATIESMLGRASRALPGKDGHPTAPDPTSSVGRWRHELSPEVEDALATTLAPILEAFGYDARPTVGRS